MLGQRHPRYMDSVKTAEVAQTDIKYSNAGKCIVSRRRAYYPPRSRSLYPCEEGNTRTTLAQYRACWPDTEPTLCERRVLVTSLLLCGLMSFNCDRYLPSDRHGARSNLFKNKFYNWRINIFHGHSIRLEYGDLIARFCTAVGDPLIPTRASAEREAPRGSATRTCEQYLFNNLPHK